MTECVYDQPIDYWPNDCPECTREAGTHDWDCSLNPGDPQPYEQ